MPVPGEGAAVEPVSNLNDPPGVAGAVACEGAPKVNAGAAADGVDTEEEVGLDEDGGAAPKLNPPEDDFCASGAGLLNDSGCDPDAVLLSMLPNNGFEVGAGEPAVGAGDVAPVPNENGDVEGLDISLEAALVAVELEVPNEKGEDADSLLACDGLVAGAPSVLPKENVGAEVADLAGEVDDAEDTGAPLAPILNGWAAATGAGVLAFELSLCSELGFDENEKGESVDGAGVNLVSCTGSDEVRAVEVDVKPDCDSTPPKS